MISEDFAFPFFGHARWLGFLEDFFAVAVLVAMIIFAVLRLVNAPDREHRASRFYGSHTGPAWVMLRHDRAGRRHLLLYRGAQYNTGHFPFGDARRRRSRRTRSRSCSATAPTTRASRRSSCSRRWR